MTGGWAELGNGLCHCIHCGRAMILDFDKTYISESGKRHLIQIFKELNWDGWDWYCAKRDHSPDMCRHRKQARTR